MDSKEYVHRCYWARCWANTAYANRSVHLPKEFVNAVASGGITSTAKDLCRYAVATFSPTLLSRPGLYEFLKEQHPTYERDSSYDRMYSFGLGWDMTSWEPYATEGIQVLGKSGGTLQYTAMLFVLPQSQSAVALLCAGHTDAVDTTLPIVDALLKETKQFTLEPDGLRIETNETKPLPTDLKSYAGYYASDAGIFRITFDEEASTMDTNTFDGSAFIHTSTSRHIEGYIFENPQGVRVAFETLVGVPSLMKIRAPYEIAEIHMIRFDEKISYLEHDFKEGFWLPTNLRPYDLFIQVHETKFIDALPSHLIVSGVATIPYAITGSRRTSMVLPALRDQTPPWIADDGSLMIGALQCMNHRDVLPLVPGETVEINAGHTSVWRRVTRHGTLSCEIPDGGRIIILGSDLKVLEDTLYSRHNRVDREVYGSYVGFIATEQTVFNTAIKLY